MKKKSGKKKNYSKQVCLLKKHARLLNVSKRGREGKETGNQNIYHVNKMSRKSNVTKPVVFGWTGEERIFPRFIMGLNPCVSRNRPQGVFKGTPWTRNVQQGYS